MPFEAITLPATNVTATKATLHGEVDPEGKPTKYWFEAWRDDWQTSGAEAVKNYVLNPIFGHATPVSDWGHSQGHAGQATLTEVAEQTPIGDAYLKVEENEGTNYGCWAATSLITTLGTDVFGVLVMKAPAGQAFNVEVRLDRTILGNNASTTAALTDEWQAFVVGPYAPLETGETMRLYVRRLGTVGSGDPEFHVAGGGVREAEAFVAEIGEFYPRPHQLESGQAVFTGTEHASSSKLATPTLVPPGKDGDAGEGTEAVPVSEEVTGLNAGVTYHFRLYATNEDGEGFGGDETFKTPVGLRQRRVRTPRRSMTGRAA